MTDGVLGRAWNALEPTSDAVGDVILAIGGNSGSGGETGAIIFGAAGVVVALVLLVGFFKSRK